MKKTISHLLGTVLFLSANFIHAQDLPTTAIDLLVGSNSIEFAIILSNVDATNSADTDPTIPDPTCAFYQGGDLW